MLNLKEISKFYPESIQYAGQFLIREYLQYKILEIIYKSRFADSLIFLGGTCLRVVHGNSRFSEDLDFDNKGLSENDFSEVSVLIRNGLNLEGYDVVIKVVHKCAFHCYVRFPGLLFKEGLSGHKEQKILIQVDTEQQNFEYKSEKFLLNKFDVFTEVFITPISTLLAQKYYAVLNRKRNKGRDFYDIAFLLSLNIEPDWKYLKQKIDISNKSNLKRVILDHCEKIDMREMARDVEPFLFKTGNANKVELFPQLIEQYYP